MNGRTIVLRGVGSAYFTTGIPVGMCAMYIESKGKEVSWLHVADDLQKQGWGNNRIIAHLKEEASLSDLRHKPDMDAIKVFLELDYEDQRAMIFEHLWGDRETALAWARTNISTR